MCMYICVPACIFGVWVCVFSVGCVHVCISVGGVLCVCVLTPQMISMPPRLGYLDYEVLPLNFVLSFVPSFIAGIFPIMNVFKPTAKLEEFCSKIPSAPRWVLHQRLQCPLHQLPHLHPPFL